MIKPGTQKIEKKPTKEERAMKQLDKINKLLKIHKPQRTRI